MKRLTGLNTAYLLTAGHDMLFQEIKEWRSDFEFYLSEINFFRKLLNKSFLHTTDKIETEKLNKLALQMENSIYLRCQDLLTKVKNEEEYLGKLEEATFQNSDSGIIKEHSQLKDKVISFKGDIKILKSNLFAVVEEIYHSEKKIYRDYNEGTLAL